MPGAYPNLLEPRDLGFVTVRSRVLIGFDVAELLNPDGEAPRQDAAAFMCERSIARSLVGLDAKRAIDRGNRLATPL